MSADAVPHDGPWPLPKETVLEIYLADKSQGGVIRGEEMVIELFQPELWRDRKASCESAGKRLSLENGDGITLLEQAQRKREAQNATAQDGIALFLRS